MSERQRIQTESAPAAVGPYSQAIVAGGLVHCSGQVAFDPATMELVGDTAAAQAERAIQNLCAVLAAAGSSPERVLKCNLYLVDMGEFAAVNEVYARTFGEDTPPARACIQAAALPKGALFEIDCVALVD